MATKEFFPKIKDRLKTKFTLTPNFTAMVTARGKTRSYLHRFKIIESPVCPCANGNQTVEHIIRLLSPQGRTPKNGESARSKTGGFALLNCHRLFGTLSPVTLAIVGDR